MKILLTFLVLVYFSILVLSGRCPVPEIVAPCNCTNQTIICGGFKNVSMKLIFMNISKALSPYEKHFNQLRIENDEIVELEENFLIDLTFKSIDISIINLNKIHTGAFNSTQFLTESLFVYHTSSLQNLPPNYDFFQAVNSLKILNKFTLGYGVIYAKLDSIPSQAFEKQQPLLHWLDFQFSQRIKRVENYAFTGVGKDVDAYILLSNNPINYIPAHTFDQDFKSTHKLVIGLGTCELNASSFEVGAFLGCKRPVEISLGGNKISYLEEEVFSSYFNANPYNSLNFFGGVQLNCCDKRLKWIIVNNQQNRVRLAKCENNKYFHEMTLQDFDKCDSVRCKLAKVLTIFVLLSILYN